MNEPPKKKSGPLKWILIGCGSLAVLGSLLVAGGLFVLFKVIKSSGSYETATHFIRTSPEVRESLGEVQDFGFLPSGHQNIRNSQGEAAWAITVKGGTGEGTVILALILSPEGSWVIQEAYLQLDGRERRIDQPGEWGPIRNSIRVSSKNSDWDD